MPAAERPPRVEIRAASDLRDWLAANHAVSGSVWLVTYKKATPDAHVSYDAVVEALLAYGWIDSLPRKLDAARTMLLISPRKPGSAWSAANKARVARLEATGRLAPPGAAAVAAARADGSWTFLDAVEALEIPADLAAAFAAAPPAAQNFDDFPRSAKRGILEWIAQARRPETRGARIAETAERARLGERANQYRPK